MNISSLHLIEMDDPASHSERFGAALLAIFAGLACFLLGETLLTEPSAAGDKFGMRLLGGLFFLGAACAPLVRRKWIDLKVRELVETTRYGGILVARRHTPLSRFTRVVVRHTAHEGEGDTSYTSDVGLEAADCNQVIWLKSFPSSEKGIDDAAREFGRGLQDRTGLPGDVADV